MLNGTMMIGVKIVIKYIGSEIEEISKKYIEKYNITLEYLSFTTLYTSLI